MTASDFMAPASSQSSEPSPVKFTLITSPAALTAVLAANMQSQVAANDALPPAPFEDMTVFHALEPPAISVSDYVARVAEYTFCSPACLVAAYHYVNKAVASDPKLALTSLSVHRLFITAIVLACKYFDDVSYNLLYYSQVGGLPYQELASLEVNMLRILDFRLDIPADKFSAIEVSMVKQLDLISPNVGGQALCDMVGRAQSELVKADIEPVELKCPSDDVDFAEIVAEHQRKRQNCRKDLHSSPTFSSCTDERSTLSRNSSMTSVCSDEAHDPEHRNVRDDSSRALCASRENKVSDSVASPQTVMKKHGAEALLTQ